MKVEVQNQIEDEPTSGWLKPSRNVRLINIFRALFLLPVARQEDGLYTFSFCRFITAFILLPGGLLALTLADYVINPETRKVSDVSDPSTIEMVGTLVGSLLFINPIITIGLTGYFVGHIKLHPSQILWKPSTLFFVLYLPLSLAPLLQYFLSGLSTFDEIHKLLINIAAQICLNLAETASRYCFIIIIDMYTATCIQQCKKLKNKRQDAAEFLGAINLYQNINASIGPALLICNSIGVILLTAITYIFAVKTGIDYIVYIGILFSLLWFLAARSQACFEHLQSLKNILR